MNVLIQIFKQPNLYKNQRYEYKDHSTFDKLNQTTSTRMCK